MLKNWFLLASVSCGVGFGSTFLISRNLQQSTWAGLGTAPAVAASMKILSRQRKEEIEHQITKSRLSLDNTQQQERLAKEEIERQVTKSRLSLEEIERQVAKSRSSLDDARQQEQLVKNSCREISAHGQKLQTGFTQLRQEVDRYRVRQAELEQEINSLVLHKQTQESLLVQLDVKVLNKQNQLETTNTELDRIQAQRQLQIDSGRQLNLQLKSIREDIRQDSAVKEQLDDRIVELQNRSQGLQTKLADKEVDLQVIEYQISQMKERRDRDLTAVAALDRSLGQKQSLLQDIALDRYQQQSLTKEISALLLQKQNQGILLDELKSNINSTQNLQSELEAQVSSTQDHLDRIAIDLSELKSKRSTAIDSARTSELTLANIHEQITQHSANKETLEAKLADLQNREKSLQAEIAIREVARTEVLQQVSVLKEEQERISIAVNELNRSIGEKQSFFDDLELEICNRQQVKEDINSQILKLEESIFLFSGHSIDETPNIRVFDLYSTWQELSQQISQLKEERNRLLSEAPEKWENHLIFENNPHLRVLKHIDIHETITLSEVGDAREQRNFNNSFGRYLEYLPFSISYREERYFKTDKESIIIANLQNPDDRTQIKQEIDKLNKQKEQLSIEIAELSRSLEQALKQKVVLRQEIAELLLKKQELRAEVNQLNQDSTSDDNSSEIIPVRYPTCTFCGHPPIPGQDRCNGCN
jgi:hypothetical protein